MFFNVHVILGVAERSRRTCIWRCSFIGTSLQTRLGNNTKWFMLKQRRHPLHLCAGALFKCEVGFFVCLFCLVFALSWYCRIFLLLIWSECTRSLQWPAHYSVLVLVWPFVRHGSSFYNLALPIKANDRKYRINLIIKYCWKQNNGPPLRKMFTSWPLEPLNAILAWQKRLCGCD